MKINGWLLIFTTCTFSTFASYAQTPPANDNYSNRIVLNGSDLTFTGNLAGATVEDDQEAVSYNNLFGGFGPATQSVWWSWTAPESTVLNLEMLSSSLDYSSNLYRAAFAVYNATNGSQTPDGLILPPLALNFINFVLTPQSVSIPVTAGAEYKIQLLGSSSGSYTMRLIATNQPCILQQPRNVTVNSNSTALFYVLAAGTNQSAITFQWLYNGNPLPMETAPMLALSNVDTNVAGAYSVIVSNSAGATFSDPGTLVVSQSNVPISLAVVGSQSNSLMFSLTGESGRNYRIETSTDLTHWMPDAEFRQTPSGPRYISVVYNPISPLNLSVPENLPRGFFRATPYAPSPQSADICVDHLAQIQLAKLLWQRDVEANATATPVTTELVPYFPRHEAPFCPLDGTQKFAFSYAINDLQTAPACLIISSTHTLEAPR